MDKSSHFADPMLSLIYKNSIEDRMDTLEFIPIRALSLKMLFKNNISKRMEPESLHNEVFVRKMHLSVHPACVMIGLCNLKLLFYSLV